jgi:vacuolar-type H+-ATPase subunit H
MHVSVKRNKLKEARLEVVGQLYKRGYSYAEIAREATSRLNPERPYSKQTIFLDCQLLLKQWKEERVQNVDDAIQKELAIIDDIIKQLWIAWDKSVLDQELRSSKKKGEISKGDSSKITTKEIEEAVKSEINYGDVRYISEIRANLIERRKLLGLYSPEKKELTGSNGGAIQTENKTTIIEYSKLSDNTLQELINASTKTT